MAEEVNTGGTKIFRYSKNNVLQLDDIEKREIREAYERADERKRKEKTIKWIIALSIILIFLGSIAYFILK